MSSKRSLLLSLLLVATLPSVQATEWNVVGSTENNEQLLVYDLDSIRKTGNDSIFVWGAWINKVNAGKAFDLKLEFSKIECDMFKHQLIETSYYLQGKLKESKHYPANGSFMRPGSIGYEFARKACSRTKSRLYLGKSNLSELTEWGQEILQKE